LNQITTLADRSFHCKNLGASGWLIGSGTERQLICPYDGKENGRVSFSTAQDIDQILRGAEQASHQWGQLSTRERSVPLFQFFRLLKDNAEQLAQIAAAEAGKTLAEARAEVAKGIEVTEFALSIQNLERGAKVEVSRGVYCSQERVPMGVVASVVPFNFPAMIPLWTLPIAVTLGNAYVLKPSEQVPITACRIGELMLAAGYPPGVFNIVHGDREAVETLLADPRVSVLGFVGSTPAAKEVYRVGASNGKRVLALGGAKNHMILLPDADPELASTAIVDSFTGCAGQRCMAGSVLIGVGDVDQLLAKVVERAANVKPAQNMGAIINRASLARITAAIQAAAAEPGTQILLDGRNPKVNGEYQGGNWLSPTILATSNLESACVQTEIFGPVLTIVRVPNLEAAMALENRSMYGNATSIFTASGSAAQRMVTCATTGMLGINVGIPVPREPFSFGGRKNSKFGQGDITGEASFPLWSDLKKVTTRWSQSGKTVF
jgi:malonate-semialdehyde dehydrogenase (acetylating) / methylmalonate-semialdehyde dehydrogenase